MALPISLGKFRLHTLIHTFPLESLLPNIVVTSIRSELNISAMYVESQSSKDYCYLFFISSQMQSIILSWKCSSLPISDHVSPNKN
jgi:hypothetical protein